MNSAPQKPPELERSLGLGRATAMVVGTIIGASIFVQPSLVTGAVGSIGGVFLAWGIAGLLTLAGALITAELASAYPETGGVYAYLRRAWSPAVGFLWAWAMFWSMHSGIIAALSMVFARYAGYFVPLSDLGLRAVAIAVILALSLVNVAGVRLGSALQTAVTVAKVGAILILAKPENREKLIFFMGAFPFVCRSAWFSCWCFSRRPDCGRSAGVWRDWTVRRGCPDFPRSSWLSGTRRGCRRSRSSVPRMPVSARR